MKLLYNNKKYMLKIFSFLNCENIKKSFYRFPLAFFYVFVFTILLLLQNNLWYISNFFENLFFKTSFTLVLIFFLSLWFYLLGENSKLSINKKSLLQLLPLLFWFVFYYFFDVDITYYSNVILFLISLVWIQAFLFFAPFVKKKFLLNTPNNIFYIYFYKITFVFLSWFVLWFLLFALWGLAFLAIEALFDIWWKITEKLYSNWAIISLALITPIVCLIELPENNEKLQKSFQINTFFAFIMKYAFVSFTIIYFIILYAYSIKVLSNFSAWPRQEVSTLVIAFSIIWYITYLITYEFEDNNKFIRIFRKFLPYTVIPQIFMLAYAIYLRVAQYDLTINRYFIMVFGLWLLIISLYFIFSKKKALIIIPWLLCIFTILISVWPWWVFSLPEKRQLSRLENNLEKAWILVRWEFFPLDTTTQIDKDLSNQIYDGIRYICNNSDCNNLAKFFNEKTPITNRYNFISQITQKLNIKYYYDNTITNERQFIYINRSDDIFPIETNNYDYIAPIDSYWYNKTEPLVTNTESQEKIRVEMLLKDNMIIVYENSEISERINMWDRLEEVLYNKMVSNNSDLDWNIKENSLPAEELNYEFEWEKFLIKIFLSSLSITNPKYTGKENETQTYVDYWYVNWYVLIKKL